MGLFATLYGAVTAGLAVSYWLCVARQRALRRPDVPPQRAAARDCPVPGGVQRTAVRP